MTETTEGTLLWEPSPEFRESAAITRYKEWIATEKDLPFEDYTALWEWSVTDLEGFWSSLWEFFDVQSSKPYEAVLGRREMPGAEWFPGAELNYAEHVFRSAHGAGPALVPPPRLGPAQGGGGRGGRRVAGAGWVPGAELTYAEHVFRSAHGEGPALVHASELRQTEETSWGELESRVAAFAAGVVGGGGG